MPPTPPPPQPVEPPIDASVLPAGGSPYDGLFRSPSLLVFAGAVTADRYRQDLPNPLISTTPLFPQLPPQAESHDPGSNASSRRSSRRWSGSMRSRSASPGFPSHDDPATARARATAAADQAFDDPAFRTLPPPPGLRVRAFPLPTMRQHTHQAEDGSTEYDTDDAYGGPNLAHINSFDLVPWHVTRDWTTRNTNIGGIEFHQRKLAMTGRGARRSIKVWQKKADQGTNSDHQE